MDRTTHRTSDRASPLGRSPDRGQRGERERTTVSARTAPSASSPSSRPLDRDRWPSCRRRRRAGGRAGRRPTPRGTSCRPQRRTPPQAPPRSQQITALIAQLADERRGHPRRGRAPHRRAHRGAAAARRRRHAREPDPGAGRRIGRRGGGRRANAGQVAAQLYRAGTGDVGVNLFLDAGDAAATEALLAEARQHGEDGRAHLGHLQPCAGEAEHRDARSPTRPRSPGPSARSSASPPRRRSSSRRRRRPPPRPRSPSRRRRRSQLDAAARSSSRTPRPRPPPPTRRASGSGRRRSGAGARRRMRARARPRRRSASSGWARPAAGRITSGYGARGSICSGGGCSGSFHYAVDLGTGCSAPIYAANSGVVRFAGWSGTYGNYVQIDHGGGIWTGYAHIRPGGTFVGIGQWVDAGQNIASSGTTGASTGCHLHYEVWSRREPHQPHPVHGAIGGSALAENTARRLRCSAGEARDCVLDRRRRRRHGDRVVAGRRPGDGRARLPVVERDRAGASSNEQTKQAEIDRVDELLVGLQQAADAAVQASHDRGRRGMAHRRSTQRDRAAERERTLGQQADEADAVAEISKMRAGLLAAHLARTAGADLTLELVFSGDDTDRAAPAARHGVASSASSRQRRLLARRVSRPQPADSLRDQARSRGRDDARGSRPLAEDARRRGPGRRGRRPAPPSPSRSSVDRAVRAAREPEEHDGGARAAARRGPGA